MLDKHFTPPISVTLRTFGTRLGIIFSNLAIIFLVLTLSGIASFLTSVLLFLFGAIVTIITVGTIFIIEPNFWNSIISGMDTTASIFDFFMQNAYIFVLITILLSIISLVLLIMDKNNKHTARIVTLVLILVIAIISIILISTILFICFK